MMILLFTQTMLQRNIYDGTLIECSSNIYASTPTTTYVCVNCNSQSLRIKQHRYVAITSSYICQYAMQSPLGCYESSLRMQFIITFSTIYSYSRPTLNNAHVYTIELSYGHRMSYYIDTSLTARWVPPLLNWNFGSNDIMCHFCTSPRI